MGEPIKRYEKVYGGRYGESDYLAEHEEGDWVRYEDHAAAVARVERERDELLAERANWGVMWDDRNEAVGRVEKQRDALRKLLGRAYDAVDVCRAHSCEMCAEEAGLLAEIDAALKETP